MLRKNFVPFFCLILMSIGCLLIIFKGYIYIKIKNKLLVLENGNFIHKLWIDSHATFSLYMFNWTNPEDFYNHSTKPILKEIGPFIFDQYVYRLNETFNDNGTVSYYRKKVYIFNKNKSIHDINFEVTIPNPMAVGVADIIKNWPYVTKKIVSYKISTLTDSKIYVKKGVGDIFLNGYDDPLLNFAKGYSYFIELPKMKKFAFLYDKNDSTTREGYFNVGTGSGIYPLGEILNWNYKNDTNLYKGNCGNVKGSSGEIFPRKIPETIDLFNPDLGRVVSFNYKENNTNNGYLTVTYDGGKKFLDNGTLFPENKCYCDGYCLPYGTIFAGAFDNNYPVYLSLPHFLNVDPSLSDKIIGLKPDAEKHSGNFAYEPETGIPVSGSSRSQMNIHIKPVEDIRLFQDVPDVLFPIFWFQEISHIKPRILFLIKLAVNTPSILLILGIFLILLSFIIFFIFIYKKHSVATSSIIIREHLKRELVPLKSKYLE